MSETNIGFRSRRGPVPPAAPPVTDDARLMTGGVRLDLAVSGMTCGHCAQTVTAALQAVPGVRSVNVSQQAGSAQVLVESGLALDPARLLAAVSAAGYAAQLRTPNAPGTTPAGGNPWQYPLWFGAVIMAGLWLGDWGLGLSHRPWYPWVAFGLALPVQVWLGGGFFRGAWRQLKAGKANMDTLVSLGSAAAFGYSTTELFRTGGGHLFFTEAVTILTFISFGHWLEARLTARAGNAVKELLQLAPSQARRVRSPDPGSTHESFEDVPVANLRIGDLLELAPGDRVAVDAEVVAGQSAVTEAMLTGEPLPVEKTIGSRLYAGTLNQSGRLRARVLALGEATALAGIVAAVQRAQSSRARIQRLADRVASIFVPVVVLIALLAAAWWGFTPESARSVHQQLSGWLWRSHVPAGDVAAAFYVFCAVLIVACPCALGLATPMALLAGVNVAARRGILIRDAIALEAAGQIDTVAFDKTGTLTLGRPTVVTFRTIETESAPVVPWRDLASAISRPSRHPFSRALVKSEVPALPVTDWREERAAGVAGMVTTEAGPVWVQLGSSDWLLADGMATPEDWAVLSAGVPAGSSLIGLTVEGRLVGVFALADPLRPDAEALLLRLARQVGLNRGTGPARAPSLLVLSGDRQTAVDAVLHDLQTALAARGVQLEARGQLRPAAKADLLAELQAAGRHVAFVGDGLNDGPALAQADLGLAVAGAADVAREAADVVLLRADLGAVVEALGIARATRRTLRQNLWWAFAYNVAAVPLAALGLLHPVICALAMGLSDVLVVGNALRLKRWRESAG